MDKSQIFHRDFFILLITNLFIINFIGFSIFGYVIHNGLLFILNYICSDIDGPVLLVFSFFSTVFLCLLITKLSLPFIYAFLEKKSNNIYVKQFIFNLKTDWRCKLLILFISFFCPIFLEEEIDFFGFIFSQFLISGFSSYIILFLWWEIEKVIKKLLYFNPNRI